VHTLKVTFEDEEYAILLKAKGKESWRKWLLKVAEEASTKEKGVKKR